MSDREDKAVAVLVAAKDAYRADPSARNKAAKAKAVAAVVAVRNDERADRTGFSVAGDAFTGGRTVQLDVTHEGN